MTLEEMSLLDLTSIGQTGGIHSKITLGVVSIGSDKPPVIAG